MGTARSTLVVYIYVCIHIYIKVSDNGNCLNTYKPSNFRNLGCFLASYVGKCSFEVSLRNTKLPVRNSQKTQLILKKKGTGRLFCEICETHECSVCAKSAIPVPNQVVYLIAFVHYSSSENPIKCVFMYVNRS